MTTEVLREQWALDLSVRIEAMRAGLALAVFTLPLGAFTAVTGLLLLGGNFVPGLSELDSQRQILACALTFGHAQQLVSRLVDERARSIVSRLPIYQSSVASAPQQR